MRLSVCTSVCIVCECERCVSASRIARVSLTVRRQTQSVFLNISVSVHAGARISFSHEAPAMPALSVHHFSGYSKSCYKKLVTHVESHTSAMSLLKRAETSAV